MRALLIESPGHAAIVDRAAPEPGPGEVLVRVAHGGLCGTDLSTYLGRNPLVSYPRVIGHEIAGTIDGAGPGVAERWAPGTPITFSPYKNCGTCAACRANRPNACRHNQTAGVQREGALAEFAVVAADRLYTSSRLSLDRLALVEPFSVGMHAVRRGRVTADDTVLVIGCGGVGAGAIAAAASTGATVAAVDVDARKLDLARRLGAAIALDGRAPETSSAVAAMNGGEGPSVVIEAVGSPATYRQAVEWVASCGRVVYLGWTKAEVPFETRHFVAKELDILGARNALGELGDVIAMFERGLVDPLTVVSDRVPLDQAPAALAAWAADPGRVNKILIDV